jgi:hypothetical protein
LLFSVYLNFTKTCYKGIEYFNTLFKLCLYLSNRFTVNHNRKRVGGENYAPYHLKVFRRLLHSIIFGARSSALSSDSARNAQVHNLCQLRSQTYVGCYVQCLLRAGELIRETNIGFSHLFCDLCHN